MTWYFISALALVDIPAVVGVCDTAVVNDAVVVVVVALTFLLSKGDDKEPLLVASTTATTDVESTNSPLQKLQSVSSEDIKLLHSTYDKSLLDITRTLQAKHRFSGVGFGEFRKIANHKSQFEKCEHMLYQVALPWSLRTRRNPAGNTFGNVKPTDVRRCQVMLTDAKQFQVMPNDAKYCQTRIHD
jgi:hypothetical protein